MKTTVEKIVVSNRASKKFICSDGNFKLSFRLARFQEKTDGVTKAFDLANNKLIVEKYGKKTGDSESYTVPQDNMEEYIKAVNEIASQEEEIDYTISLSLFEGEKTTKEFFIEMGDFIVE